MTQKIADWADIKEQFKGTLLIGNGASQAVYSGFSYANIYEQATQLEHITPAVKSVFENFETQDFESVLRHLWHASIVNKCLEINDEEIENAYKEVRDALIKTVHSIHVTYQNAEMYLDTIGSFIRQFKNIVSMNYDLLLYWSFLKENDKNHKNPYFKDGFVSGKLREELDELYEPYKDEKSTCLIVYPHGSLFIGATTSFGQEMKIGAAGNNLLDQITNDWAQNKVIPVFVSEADSKKKMFAIRQSNYLTRIYYEVLPKLISGAREHDQSLTLYGWSMGDQDTHILKQLAKNRFKRIAISFRDENKINAIAQKIKSHLKDIDITFYPSESKGAWCNALN